MKPQYVAKNPIIIIKYRSETIIFKIGTFKFWMNRGLKINNEPKINRIEPCAISPNITPNKKGNVTVVNKEGLIYLYRGTPYVSTICCAGIV